MCGIVGLIRARPAAREDLLHLGRRMGDRLSHRGPDDAGQWVSGDGRVMLGHRRLSIVDLSALGHQPMGSRSERYQLVLNGEIYNHRQLRKELLNLGHGFRGSSDTEVLLAAIEQWGLEEAIPRCTGMFAIGLWDQQEAALTLVRDRLGEKPIYVQFVGDSAVFASELRALREARSQQSVDVNSVALLMRYGYVPDPHCILNDIHKVPAATIETWTLHADRIEGPRRQHYWNPASNGRLVPRHPGEAVWNLENLLCEVIEDQRVADVPVGALLSGGVDSTVVTALMQSSHDQPIRTFCVNFGDAAYNEGLYARKIAEHLGTDHTQVDVSEDELLDVVQRLPRVYDEPFADSSQVPMVLVSQAARRHVTVALTGDGGDELFGGYNRYYYPARIRRRFQAFPPAVRVGVGRTLGLVSEHLPKPALSLIQQIVASGAPIQDLRGKLRKAGLVLTSPDPVALYSQLISYWPDPGLLVPAWDGSDAGLLRLAACTEAAGGFAGQTLWDIENYLPGDNLVKVDRASMSVALELRAPLLDHRICEYARGMIERSGFDAFDAGPKWPLKQILARHVPYELTERPKMGFSVPLGAWLRAGLKDWALRLVDDVENLASDLLAVDVLRTTWDSHQSGKADLSSQLWPALMLLAWLDEYRV